MSAANRILILTKLQLKPLALLVLEIAFCWLVESAVSNLGSYFLKAGR